jgi:predicted dehydrogenase
MLTAERLDAVSIATPPVDRLKMIEAALDHGVRLVWCEKPMAASLSEARAIERRVGRGRAIFAVNYIRRWTATARRMPSLVKSGQLGEPQGGAVYYGKGLLNNGSHAIDLLGLLFGQPDTVEAIARVADDRAEGDETLTGTLHYRRPQGAFSVQLIGTDHRRYSLFEIDLLFEGGRLRLTEKGNRLEVQTVAEDPVFPGYRALRVEETLAGDLSTAFDEVLAQLLAVRRGRDRAPFCGAADGLGALAVVEGLRRSWQTSRPVATSERGPTAAAWAPRSLGFAIS